MTILFEKRARINGKVMVVKQVHCNRHRQDIAYIVAGVVMTSEEFGSLNPVWLKLKDN